MDEQAVAVQEGSAVEDAVAVPPAPPAVKKTAARPRVPKVTSASLASPRAASKSPAKDLRILEQPGFVLHSWPYKETSLIIDVLTRDHGRIALVAKGAKRPHSQLRSV